MKPQPRYHRGERIANRYLVHQALLGGMAEVYLCLDLEENYPYALKTFQQRYVTDVHRLRQSLEQEVITWVALEKHPNIVRCFWMQILNHQPFIALEWVAGDEDRGTDLRSWLRRGPLELKVALQITIDICQGLLYAQAKRPGLVHRDLKPDNILMAQDGLAKITDFGLAQLAETAGIVLEEDSGPNHGRQSPVGGKGIAGTPAYMAPEQWRGEPLDERTDIYALGCMFYELLTGTAPFAVTFAASTPQQVQHWRTNMQHAHEKLPPPKLPTTFAPTLQDLLASCLAKAQRDRPAHVKNLLIQLTTLYHQQFDQSPPTRPAPGSFTEIDYNNRGATYHALGQYAQALADFDRGLERAPNSVLILNNRANTYQALGQLAEALADFDRVLALDPNLPLVLSNRGITYQALGQHEQALADFTRALQLNPNFADAYFNRGVTYRAHGEDAKALADFTQAIELNPNFAQAHFSRGNIYQALGLHAQALADFTQAIELNPNYAAAYANRGNSYQTLGQYTEALADFTAALTLDPHLAQAYSNRGLTYQALGQQTQALADFRRAVELEPQAAIAYFNRGTAYTSLGQYDQAVDDFQRAIELNPDYIQAYANRGNIYGVLGQPIQALTDFNRAIELNPNDAQLYSNRGNIYQSLGQTIQAAADYRQAIKLTPGFAPAYYNLGVTLAKQGQLHEALPYLEQAVHLGFSPGTQALAQVKQMLSRSAAPPSDPTEATFAAFLQADSPQKIQQALIRFPLLAEREFIAAIEQVIAKEVPPADRPAFTQRLTWLRQLATTQPRSTP